jgi:hypothetical protein
VTDYWEAKIAKAMLDAGFKVREPGHGEGDDIVIRLPSYEAIPFAEWLERQNG